MDTQNFRSIFVGDLREEYPRIDRFYGDLETGYIRNGGICWAVAACNALGYLTGLEPSKIAENTLNFGVPNLNSTLISPRRLGQSIRPCILFPEEAGKEMDGFFLTNSYGLKTVIVSSRGREAKLALEELRDALDCTGAVVTNLIFTDSTRKPRYEARISFHSVCIVKDPQGQYFLYDPNYPDIFDLSTRQVEGLFNGDCLDNSETKIRINRGNPGTYFKKNRPT